MWRLLSNVVTWLVKCEGESNKNQQNHSLPVLKSNPETLVSKLGFLGSFCFLGRKHTPLKSIMKRQKLCENYWSFPTIKGAVFIFLPFFFFVYYIKMLRKYLSKILKQYASLSNVIHCEASGRNMTKGIFLIHMHNLPAVCMHQAMTAGYRFYALLSIINTYSMLIISNQMVKQALLFPTVL